MKKKILKEIEELKKSVEKLKLLHNIEYVKEVKLKKLLKEYNKLIDTDIWYEAAKEYFRKVSIPIIENSINTLSLRIIFYENNISPYNTLNGIYSLSDSNDDYIGYTNIYQSDVNKINFDEIHNTNVEIEEYKFEKFCVEFSKTHSMSDKII